jgi:hypothetical protein
MHSLKRFVASASAILVLTVPAFAQGDKTDTRPAIAPDIREDGTRLKLQRGDFVAVPIPISNPTLDTGIVAGAAYFYPQSEEQKKRQPASVTAAAGMYTSNDSRALALVQQNYWRQDRWRFTGALGAADLRLSLLAPPDETDEPQVDWRIDGSFIMTKIARRISGDWYGGVFSVQSTRTRAWRPRSPSKTSIPARMYVQSARAWSSNSTPGICR